MWTVGILLRFRARDQSSCQPWRCLGTDTENLCGRLAQVVKVEKLLAFPKLSMVAEHARALQDVDEQSEEFNVPLRATITSDALKHTHEGMCSKRSAALGG